MPTNAEHTGDGGAPRHGQRVLGNARSAARAVAMSGWTVAVTQSARVYMTLTRVPERQRVGVTQHFMEHWAGGLLNVFGIEPHWLGAATPRPRKARLVVANHRSPVHILLMIPHFRGSVLGRHDLERWPLLGWAARAGGTIFVDRTDPRSGVRAIREIRRRLSAGQTVIVFPEGTTHRGDEVRPFLGGAFAAVRGLDVELVPVGVAYDPGSEFVDETFVEHMKRMAQRPRTRVALCAGEPCNAHADRDALAAEMQREVQALVQRARAALSDTGHSEPHPR